MGYAVVERLHAGRRSTRIKAQTGRSRRCLIKNETVPCGSTFSCPAKSKPEIKVHMSASNSFITSVWLLSGRGPVRRLPPGRRLAGRGSPSGRFAGIRQAGGVFDGFELPPDAAHPMFQEEGDPQPWDECWEVINPEEFRQKEDDPMDLQRNLVRTRSESLSVRMDTS
jgi:hypothetical protein